MKNKICIITGTRAEYGLLKPLIQKVHESETSDLQLAVTGMHLSPEFGLTYQEIEKDGYPVTAKIEMLLSSDTPAGITKSMGVAMIGFADFFETHKPDIAVILGDRYEMLAAAAAAMAAAVPIAHIHGGELTEGIMDEQIRHSITKMSHLHFTSTEEYRRRVIQLGEQPQMVYNVGALGIENIKKIKLLDKQSLEKELGFSLSDVTVLVTYHPVSLENMSTEVQFQNILDVLDEHKEITVIFTKANSDINGRIINQMIDEFVSRNRDRCAGYVSLGQLKYLSTLQFCRAVLGNSSSGIIEVPSFGIPTVNIGDRQRRRLHAKSVIDCGNEKEQVEAALEKALSAEFLSGIAGEKNPYEGKQTADKIYRSITEALGSGIHMKKEFYDVADIGV